MDFESIKKSFVKTTDQIIKTSGEVVDTTKAGFAVAKTKNQMDDLYKALGKRVYELNLEQNMLEDEAACSLCRELDDLRKTLSEQEEQLRKLKHIHVCPACGKETAEENAFCPYCGKPIEN